MKLLSFPHWYQFLLSFAFLDAKGCGGMRGCLFAAMSILYIHIWTQGHFYILVCVLCMYLYSELSVTLVMLEPLPELCKFCRVWKFAFAFLFFITLTTSHLHLYLWWWKANTIHVLDSFVYMHTWRKDIWERKLAASRTIAFRARELLYILYKFIVLYTKYCSGLTIT